jgi:hypothetical protein
VVLGHPDLLLLTPVDVYCERVGAGFWAEPLNAITNLAILGAAVAVWLIARRTPLAVRLLAVPVAFVALAGLLFHTTAASWAAEVDTGSITLFLTYYVVLFTHLFLVVPWRVAWLAGPVFLLFTALVSAVVGYGGAGIFISTLLTLAFLAYSLARSPYRELRAHSRPFALATGVFLVSLALRTMDSPLCDSLPTGTHFLWHLLNAVALFLVCRAAVARWHQRQRILTA